MNRKAKSITNSLEAMVASKATLRQLKTLVTNTSLTEVRITISTEVAMFLAR